MDLRKDISEFLTTRRGRITPEQAGLPSYSENRRVAGLRREEVAMLAGVSVDYYTRIERGQLKGVSESVISGIARVLNLDDAERGYLNNLVQLSNPTIRTVSKPKPSNVRQSILRLLDTMDSFPAYVRNDRLDIVAHNALTRQLFAPMFSAQPETPNVARFVFLDENSRDFFIDWEKIAKDSVGVLRSLASVNPYDKKLTDLIGELCTRSEFFRVHWAAHEVFEHKMGTKRFRHPEVGELDLNFEILVLPQDPGLVMATYFAAKNSPSENALKLLKIAEYESRTQTDAAFEK